MDDLSQIFLGKEVKEKFDIADLEPSIREYAAETQSDVEKRMTKTRELLEGWALAIENDNTIVLKEADSVVGIARLTLKGEIERNPVFEIENLYVKPEQRGHGFSKVLREKLVEHLKRLHPNAYIISCTQNPRVKAAYDRLVSEGKAEDIGHGTYLRTYTEETIGDDEIQREVEQGWRAYRAKVSDL